MKEHRLVGAFALLILTLCITGIAQARVTDCNASTPNNALCLVWTAPATNTDGSPTVLPITYRVEQRVATTGTWAAIGTVATLKYYVTALAPGNYEFRVFAIAGGVESDSSNVAGGTATASKPNSPVLTIAVVISAERAPVFKIASNGVSIGSTLYGLVPVGRECGAKIATWRGVSINRVAVQPSEVWPKGTSTNNLAAPCG